MNYYIGVDPGNKGAIAIIDQNRKLSKVFMMPTFKTKYGSKKGKDKTYCDNNVVHNELQQWYEEIAIDAEKVIVGLETLHVTARAGAYGAFNMGVSYGLLWGTIETFDFDITLFKSTDWQKTVMNAYTPKLKAKGLIKPKMEVKDISIILAKAIWGKKVLYPTSRHTTPQDGIADALLIAECMRIRAKGK